MTDRRTLELVLLLILSSTGGIFACALERWLFCGIFAAESVWAIALMALLLESD